MKLPELLAPAGSPDALDAAIEGGADAVYLGGAAFNARMNAHNFGGDALRSAVLRAHSYGVKVYLTLNTMVHTRELSDFVACARNAADAGVDALIVADLGGACAIHRAIPSLELHASTQMSGHNSSAAKELERYGFSRMVIARETSAADLEQTVKESPLEIEMFIHGALCVSHSGQCLFSSLVGGRSGNRGECAQPCRLPYTYGNDPTKAQDTYPLSLKDLSLATHVPRLIASGVASLKIEGRMKSPEYVRDTTRIWRRLLDEGRAATPDEMRTLADIFSRGGFTDGYYTERIDRSMLGVRSDKNKDTSRTLTPFSGITKKLPLHFVCRMHKDRPMTLSIKNESREITVTGETVQEAITAPLSHEAVERNLSKLGGTPYALASLSLEMDEGVMVPLSQINALRRNAISLWESTQKTTGMHEKRAYVMQKSTNTKHPCRTARFYTKEQITPRARKYFDRIYLPLEKACADAHGVVLPPVIFERKLPLVEEALRKAALCSARYALVGNIGHLELVRRAGLVPVGDYRFNIANDETVSALESMGLEEMILSPELTLPQARDLSGNVSLIVYGRIPLMTLEKCVGRKGVDCQACERDQLTLTDRRGFIFPVLREWEHRHVIYNSLPTSMSDRADALLRAGITATHFVFSAETADEVDRVIDAFEYMRPLAGQVRRI